MVRLNGSAIVTCKIFIKVLLISLFTIYITSRSWCTTFNININCLTQSPWLSIQSDIHIPRSLPYQSSKVLTNWLNSSSNFISCLFTNNFSSNLITNSKNWNKANLKKQQYWGKSNIFNKFWKGNNLTNDYGYLKVGVGKRRITQ